MKIAAYTIALNEMKHVDRWYESVKDADYLIVADTGSTDGTVEALRALGVSVYSVSIKPWRFDVARNAALDLVPQDADICISLDMDELMAPGWRAEVEKNWLSGTTRLRYTYVYSFTEDDQPLHSFMADKMHSRSGYHWQRPIHETVYPTGDEQTVGAPSVVMYHKQDTGKSRGQYLPLLALSHDENPHDSQLTFWLAREHGFYGNRDEAVKYFKEYLDMPESGWADERSEAMKWLADLLPHEKLTWLRRSAAEAPHRREVWINLCDHYYGVADWPNLYAAAVEGTRITSRTYTYLDNPSAFGGRLWDHGGIAAWNLGMMRESLRMFTEAARLEPGDTRIQSNLALAAQSVAAEQKQ
jgi:glycosyltransferase involved in cell wall biosynthesis